MGKKKRSHPSVNDLLARPWCYYCERDFEDLKLLISHQKAKHFKCDRCGKRLNTAGGLSVHMNQVHKESLSSVENALSNRQGLDIEIFGMEGIPEDVLQQHNQRIIQNFYQAQAERQAATGNPVPGQHGAQRPTKKIKMECEEDLLQRLAEHCNRSTRKGGDDMPGAAPPSASPPSNGSSYPPQAGYPYAPPGMLGAPPQHPVPYPHGGPPPPGYPASVLPTRPTSNGPPPFGTYPVPFGPPPVSSGEASTLDELVAGAAAKHQDNNVEHVAQSADSAPAQNAPQSASAPAEDKKSKKEKHARMVYADTERSPEERMAQMPRYAVAPST